MDLPSYCAHRYLLRSHSSKRRIKFLIVTEHHNIIPSCCCTMSSPSSLTASPTFIRRRVELQDCDLDCPSPTCNGWLRLFGSDEDKTPNFVSCSNDYTTEDGIKMCTQKVMLSKFFNKCPSCSQMIKAKSIIACTVGGSWMHAACFQKSHNEPSIFALCQRCRKAIKTEEDCEHSMCGGVAGYKHLKCPNKVKYHMEKDDELFSSQGGDDDATTVASSSSSLKKTRTK